MLKAIFIAQASNSLFSTLVILPTMIDKIAAAKLNNAPIFAASCTGPASKATVATNSETVKPIAATKPITIRSVSYTHLTLPTNC